jgi:MFS transporter, DHA3 family, multidrug efflux protein
MPLVFYHLLGNNLVANITNFTVWFAVTFWVFLETQSVFATGMIAGIYLVFTAGFGFWFGSLVDHYPKKLVMLGSSVASFVLYAVGLAILFAVPEQTFRDVSSVWLWAFILIIMLGVIAGNIRSITLPTLVTVLIKEDIRDKANGLVGMVTGIGFLSTSVISGFLVAWGGMHATLIFSGVLTAVVFAHLITVSFEEKPDATPSAAKPDTPKKPPEPKRVDIKGTIAVIALVPGLFALIFFATFNNFLGGVFMALADAYGLSLVSVEVWGLLLGVLSTAFIISGIVISRTGLGKNPLWALMIVNVIVWTTCIFFTIQSSIWLLSAGFFIWMFCGPWAEAAEHTTLQKVVPPERQGRVFGFAQSIEQAASPLTAFLIGPLTQFIVIPFMSEGGAGAAAIGGWFGVGPERGIALVFTLAGMVGLVVTIIAFNSKYYRDLSAAYAKAPDPDEGEEKAAEPSAAE